MRALSCDRHGGGKPRCLASAFSILILRFHSCASRLYCAACDCSGAEIAFEVGRKPASCKAVGMLEPSGRPFIAALTLIGPSLEEMWVSRSLKASMNEALGRWIGMLRQSLLRSSSITVCHRLPSLLYASGPGCAVQP